MATEQSRYIFENEWLKRGIDPNKETRECIRDEISVRVVENGTILPQRPGKLIWGDGGCVDADGLFVQESAVCGAFGGGYEYSKDADYMDESVIYIPIIPHHWGHFLIDVVSRLYIISDQRYYWEGKKILYCSWRFAEGKLTGNYLSFFKLLGVNPDQLILVQNPVRIREIVIPDAALSYSTLNSCKYMIPVHYAVRSVLDLDICHTMKKYDKIYFTRTRLHTSKNKEIGEKEIEALFADNGYRVMSPEKMTLEQQIFFIQNCKKMAGMSGTIPHNIVFARPGMELIIINRTCIPNPPQLLLNRLCKGVKVTYIDAYHKSTIRHPSDYGSGPFWIEVNDNVRRFCMDQGMKTDRRLTVNKRKNAVRYYMLLLYHRCSRNKLTIKGYRKIKELIFKIR